MTRRGMMFPGSRSLLTLYARAFYNCCITMIGPLASASLLVMACYSHKNSCCAVPSAFAHGDYAFTLSLVHSTCIVMLHAAFRQ